MGKRQLFVNSLVTWMKSISLLGYRWGKMTTIWFAFFSCLIVSLQEHIREIGEDILEKLQLPKPLDTEALLTKNPHYGIFIRKSSTGGLE